LEGFDMNTVRTFQITKRVLVLVLVVVLTIMVCLGLTSCAEQGVTRAMSVPRPLLAQPDYFPGGYSQYSYGTGQAKSNLDDVEIAQSSYGVWGPRRSWVRITAGQANGHLHGLQAYSPLHVRWKLKDGREFIVKNIDVRTLMHEYFKTNKLQLQWQKEGRPKSRVGDFGPVFAHEVKHDTVILKWVITINRTPVDKRLTPTGAANFWDTYDEEYVVAVLKGNPTSGIDFNNTREFVQ
jgi:hypothetical protein